MLSCDVFVPDFNTLFGRVHSQLAAGGNAPFISCVLLSPTQGARGAGSPQTGLQRGSLQQTVPSSNPGAELFLAVPPGTVGSAQEPSSSDPPATGPWPESVQHSGIHGWGHSRYTPVSFQHHVDPCQPHPTTYLTFYSHFPTCAEAEWDYFENRAPFNLCLMAVCGEITRVGGDRRFMCDTGLTDELVMNCKQKNNCVKWIFVCLFLMI